MAVIKRKTVKAAGQKQRIGLKKLKNDLNTSGQFKYVIEDLDTGAELEGAFTTKRDAKRAFRQAVDDIERGMQASANDASTGSMASGVDPFGDFL